MWWCGIPEGMWDWQAVYDTVQPFATFLAGILFGTAHAVWADAVVYSIAVLGLQFNAVSVLPGLAATLAIICMNLVGRGDVMDSIYQDDAALNRSRCCLLLSYLVSLGSIAGSVALLIIAKQAGDNLWVGAAGVIQCVLILSAGVLSWFFHTSSDSGSYSYL